MTAHDDAARDTANARADALLAMHARLEAVTAERDELAAKVARVEALHTEYESSVGDVWCDACEDAWPCATTLALRGNP
jgi:hypothetical protein